MKRDIFIAATPIISSASDGVRKEVREKAKLQTVNGAKLINLPMNLIGVIQNLKAPVQSLRKEAHSGGL